MGSRVGQMLANWDDLKPHWRPDRYVARGKGSEGRAFDCVARLEHAQLLLRMTAEEGWGTPAYAGF